MEFPGGTQDENLPANAEDTGSILCPVQSSLSRKIPHSSGQLSLCVTNYWACTCSAMRSHSPQPEKAHAQPRRPSAAKTTKLIFKNLGEQKSIDGESENYLNCFLQSRQINSSKLFEQQKRKWAAHFYFIMSVLHFIYLMLSLVSEMWERSGRINSSLKPFPRIKTKN